MLDTQATNIMSFLCQLSAAILSGNRLFVYKSSFPAPLPLFLPLLIKKYEKSQRKKIVNHQTFIVRYKKYFNYTQHIHNAI